MITRMFWVHKALAGAFGLYIRPVFIFTAIFLLYFLNSLFIFLQTAAQGSPQLCCLRGTMVSSLNCLR